MGPSADNIRTLIYFLGLTIDEQLAEKRRFTLYAKVRPSDVRVFITAARTPTTISGIARQLHISRQAAQTTVHRLQELGVVTLSRFPGNLRDKQVVITNRGKMATVTAARQIADIESRLEDIIDPQEWRGLKLNLKKLVGAFAQSNDPSTEPA